MHNLSLASTGSPIVYFDTVSPEVAINQATDQPDPTNINSAIFTIVFTDRLATDLTADKLTLNGTSTGTVSVVKNSDTIYTATVSNMTSGDTVSLSLVANQVSDRAGNQNTASASTDNGVHYTTDRPSVDVALATDQAGVVRTEPIRYQVQFSVAVTGFDANDVMISGSSATVDNVVEVNGRTYIVELSDLSDGDSWVLNLSNLNPPLESGVYNIEVDAELIDGRVLRDVTIGELVIVDSSAGGMVANPDARVGLASTGMPVWVFSLAGLLIFASGAYVMIGRRP